MTNMSGVSINTPMTVKVLGCHRSAMKKQNEAANAEQAISSNSIMFTAVIAHHLTISDGKAAHSRLLEIPPVQTEKAADGDDRDHQRHRA